MPSEYSYFVGADSTGNLPSSLSWPKYDSLLQGKVNSNDLDALLANKANQADVNTQLSTKADQATVLSELATKADQTTVAPLVAAKTYDGVSGTLTLDTSAETHIVNSVTAATLVSVGAPAYVGQGITLLVQSGGANITISADGFPKGTPTLADADLVNFVAISDSKWWALGSSAPASNVPTKDTTPPSQPSLTQTAVTDTTATFAVVRGVDRQSDPTLEGRYYLSGSTSVPDFAAITLDASNQWNVSGLTQNASWVFEIREESEGGTSAVTSLTVKTAKTHGWVISESLNLNVPDGTLLKDLLMTDGQALQPAGVGGGAVASIVGGKLVYPSNGPDNNGSMAYKFNTTTTTKLTRIRADYTFGPGAGTNTSVDIKLSGWYPLGTLGLSMEGDGSLKWDLSGANATWGTPTWTQQDGFDQSGTFSLVLDSTGCTAYAYVDGNQVGSVALTDTSTPLPGVSGGTVGFNLWGGGSATLNAYDIMIFQN